MTLANQLTVLRILLIPVFVLLLVYDARIAALIVFLLTCISDVLDGYIARTWRQQTTLGTFLDPIADKLLMVTTFATLALLQALPMSLTILLIGRDVLLSLVIGIVLWTTGRRLSGPTLLGRAAIFGQMWTVALGLFFYVFEDWPVIATLRPLYSVADLRRHRPVSHRCWRPLRLPARAYAVLRSKRHSANACPSNKPVLVTAQIVGERLIRRWRWARMLWVAHMLTLSLGVPMMLVQVLCGDESLPMRSKGRHPCGEVTSVARHRSVGQTHRESVFPHGGWVQYRCARGFGAGWRDRSAATHGAARWRASSGAGRTPHE